MTPEKFKIRMEKLLGPEYPAFIDALENQDAVRAVRVNNLKTDVSEFVKNSHFNLTSLPYTDEGFIIENSDGIGQSPEHHSGMIYVQDPAAMSPLCALDILPGWRVLDLCSAPGGKSGQAAAKIGDSGFIHSNEYIPKRAKITVSNFERLGIKNAFVTSLDTKELASMYENFFDLVIADVPCSGEGMFRKSFEANDEWSEENVRTCALRQTEILNNSKSLVKEGGYLIYSTCTYSLEENEMIIDKFLSENTDYSLVPVREELSAVTADGINFDGAYSKNLILARRFYPHISRGEGQFCALLKRCTGRELKERILYSDASSRLSKSEDTAVKNFFKENLISEPCGTVCKVGENIILKSHGMPVPKKSVFSAGVLLGRVEKCRLIPAHQFFSCFGKLFKRQENLTRGDIRVEKYLRGEEISQSSFEGSGWCAVIYEGAPLGGGKASLGMIKNHYPKGLRNN